MRKNRRSKLHILATTTVFCLVQALSIGHAAGAGILDSLVVGTQNTFEDQDRQSLLDLDNSGTISVGDVSVGYLRVDGRSTPLPGQSFAPDNVYTAFSIQVTSISSDFSGTPRNPGDAAVISFGPTVSVQAMALGLDLPSLLGNPVNVDADDVAASYMAVGQDLINTAPVGATTIFDFITVVSGGQLEVTADLSAVDDKWTAQLNAEAATIVDNLAVLNNLTLAGGIPGQNGFFAGSSVDFNADPSIDFADLVILAEPDPQNPTTHELTIVNGEISGASDLIFAGIGNPYFFAIPDGAGGSIEAYGLSSNADLSVFPVPEPCAGILFVLGFVYVFRRSGRSR